MNVPLSFEAEIDVDATRRREHVPAGALGDLPRLRIEQRPVRHVGSGEALDPFTRANLQPGVAAYVHQPGDSAWRALALDVLHIEDGLIAEIVTFSPDCFPAFGLPMDAAP